MPNTSFDTLDWLVLGLYFALLLGVAIWVIRQRQRDTTDYFLAGRNVGWFVIGASIFASNIGSEHLVGLAGAGHSTGVVFGHYEIHAYLILLLGWVFVPYYIRSGVFTMPEFLEKRFNSGARWFLSIVSLVGYVLTKVSVTIYAGGVVFETLLGIDFWTGALTTVVLTGIYTVLGGLRAVVYTEVVQTIVLLLGASAVTFYGLSEIGGWSNLRDIAGSEHFNMWKPIDDPRFPWPALLFGTPIVGFWYWCTDQYIVQRVLAAKNISIARRGAIFGAYLKLMPIFLFMIPGIIAFALQKSGRLELGASDQALPALVMTLLPAGLRGLVAGGLLAALMSSLASLFNSCSTLFTKDIYEKLRPDTSEKKLVRVGRLATGAVVLLGILWIPLMSRISGQLYEYLQSVQAYIAPPIAATFLLGVFFRRINGKGALAALVGGFLLGMLRLVLELNKTHLSGFWRAYAEMNFLYFCIALFVACVLILTLVSLLSERPPLEKVEGLTFGSAPDGPAARIPFAFTRWDVAHTIIVLLGVLGVFLYFTG
jgi:SSS family solute:Na+ symporter